MTSAAVLAQGRRADMREGLEAQKVAFITEELSLSAEEAQVFWPIYNKHDDDLAALRDKYPVPTSKNLQNLSDQEASAAIDNYIAREREKLAIKQSLINDLDGVISDRKVAVLLGLEGEFKRRLLKAMKRRRGSSSR